MRLKFCCFPLIILCTLLVITACAQKDWSSGRPATAGDTPDSNYRDNKLQTVKVGDLGILSSAGNYIAKEKGYFEEEGLDVEFIKLSTSDQIVALTTGDLDVGAGAITAAVYNANSEDIKIKIIADHGTLMKNMSNTSFVVRKDLIESGQFNGYVDLKGLRIGTPSLGNNVEIFLEKVLEKGNLTLDDVLPVVLGYPEMLTAFENGSIDAAIYNEPFITFGINSGLIERWAEGYDIYPNQQIAAIMFSSRLAEEDKELGKKYVKAYVRGLRDYADAFQKGINRDEIVDILVQHTSIEDRSLFDQMALSGLNPDGYLNEESLRHDAAWYVSRGLVEEEPDLNEIYDKEFLDYAMEELGRYE